ncbi:MAG TPA: hypothetical protein VF633_04965, partial [Brevundimonas sp.]
LAADLAAGLEAIHARGQLHLNLAPESIGVASGRGVLHDPSADRRRYIPLVRRLDGLFRTGLSPFEAQDATESAPLTPATDIYGLCAVLYRVVTGRDAPDWFGWSDDTRLSAQPEAAGYPAAFVAAVEKGLSRNAADRVASVSDWRAAAGVGEPAPVEGRVWFDAVEDFRVPPAPPGPVDELALAPPSFAGPADPVVVDDIGALRRSPEPVPFTPSRTVTPSPQPRRSKAFGIGAVAAVAGLVAVVAFAGSRLTGDSSKASADEGKVSTRAAPPRAPDGCAYRTGEDADDLTLRCGPGEGQVVDRGALRVSDVADAVAGRPGAMARLGAFYLRDTPGRDERAGLDWLGRAAAAGETSAMLDLADFYETSATDASAAGTPAALRQSLQWYRTVSDPGQGAHMPSPDQIRLADEGVQRIEARLTEVRDAAFVGCWRSGDVVADLRIDNDIFTLAVEGGEPAVGQIAEPRQDDRIAVRLDSPGLMSGQRYLFSRVGADMIEHRLDVSTENARWNRCSAE